MPPVDPKGKSNPFLAAFEQGLPLFFFGSLFGGEEVLKGPSATVVSRDHDRMTHFLGREIGMAAEVVESYWPARVSPPWACATGFR